MRKHLFLTLFIASVSLPSTAETIRIATGEYPPLLSESLPENGPGLALIRNAFSRKGIDVEFGFFPWSRAYIMVDSGEWDASATWYKRPDREENNYFSDPLYVSEFALFYRGEQQPNWTVLADLSAFKIGATRGYSYSEEFWQLHETEALDVDIAESDLQNLKRVTLGRVDLVLANRTVGQYLLEKHFSEEVSSSVKQSTQALMAAPVYVIFSKSKASNIRLLSLFNEGLREIKSVQDD